MIDQSVEKRDVLKPHVGTKRWFAATYIHTSPVNTDTKDFARVLFRDVEFLDGCYISDHVWVTISHWSKRRKTKNMLAGKRYKFKGAVEEYLWNGCDVKYGIAFVGRMREL